MEEQREMTPLQQLHSLVEETKTAYDQIERELQEIALQQKQSSSEVERLAQRNAQIASRVRQIEINLESYPREDIKEAYIAAQDSQMRLFTMRSQVERLQSKQEALQAKAEQLRRFLEVAQDIEEPSPTPSRESTIVRVIEAQENERRRLARQMHDGPAQSLTNLILQAEICERLFDLDPKQAHVELENLKQAVNATFQNTRRFIFGLRPMMLDDLGLVPTLRRYIQDFREKSRLSIDLHIMGEERQLAPHLEVTIFRVIQELLNNVDQHAHAAHVDVTLDLEGEAVAVTVEDDGCGFDAEEVLAAVRERKSVGLLTIQERTEMLGGKVEIDSSVGRGTKVRLELPEIVP
jgi:two-component system sensor histidine kinase DegS